MRVLFLDLDTLRPDHLGCYGYRRDTSPNIDRIAASGVRFENYYASDAPCLPSRAALVSGMFGIHNGAVNHGGTCADMRIDGASRGFHSAVTENALWNVFRAKGLHTCTISPFAERHSSYWFLAGFNEMHNHVGKRGNESAEEITPVVLKWLDDNKDREDWLLHVNYWDPHTPYRAPEDFGNPFAANPLPEWLTEDVLERHKTLAGPHTARDNGMYTGQNNPKFPRHPMDIHDMKQLRRCIDGYDCGIRYMDVHIGAILDKLEAQGLLADTAIIVTSDHGENFGELGVYSEHGTADQATCRIPMIVKWPGCKAGYVDRGLHYNVDLAPTLCDLLDVELPGRRGHWDGRSYVESVLHGADTGREELVLSQCAHVCQRSVRWGPWLYMRTTHDGLHPHFQPEMLFNVEQDPHETNDLTEKMPAVRTEGAARLLRWHEQMMRSQPFGWIHDPMDVLLSERGPEHAALPCTNYELKKYRAYFIRLQETGRGHWIEKIIERHPKFKAALP